MNNNRKGFTLVEIIVSISIGLVVLAIVGSMILSSFDFMFSTTDMDIDKRAIDSIIKLVREDVEYAYDVRLMDCNDPNAPTVGGEDGWHCYYVKDGVLYRDEEKVLSDEYYNHKTFTMESKGNYQNGIRVDFTYTLNNSKEDTYSARDTIMFLNVQVSDSIKQGGLYTKESTVPLTDGEYRLYYNGKSGRATGTPDEPDEPDGGISGTVKDQIELIGLGNCKGEFLPNTYHRGDYVYYDGYWWVWISPKEEMVWAKTPPGDINTYAHKWKKIDSNWDTNSGYMTGDIVYHNGKYYKCTSDLQIDKEESYEPGVYYDWSDANNLWQELPDYHPIEKNLIECEVPSDVQDKKNETIIKKLNGVDLNSIPTYDGNNNHYNSTDNNVVKIEIGNTGIYQYYIKLFDNLGEPGKMVYNKDTELFEVGWQRISLDIDDNSAYLSGDIVHTGKYRYDTAGGIEYIIATDYGGQKYSYNTQGNLVSTNPDNAGKINFFVPLSKSLENFTNEYQYWWKKLY